MAYNISFPPRQSSASKNLPLTLISLEDWVLVQLEGPDTKRYLQGQITVDIETLADDKHVLCGHCDAKGKMWSNLRLFRRGKGFAYLQRRSVLEIQLAEIKKYAVFSKITIAVDNNAILTGVAGAHARAAMESVFTILPDARHQVIEHEGTYILHFTEPAERFLLIATAVSTKQLVEKLNNQTELNNSGQWLVLDIEAGYPIIDSANSALLIPQSTNLQALQGIDFSKGCYTGQEMVARAKFRGANKRAMYFLAGKAMCTPKAAENLELKLGKNWRRTGTVLAASTLSDGTLWVQAVMNNNIEDTIKIRVPADSNSQLEIKPLSYMLKY